MGMPAVSHTALLPDMLNQTWIVNVLVCVVFLKCSHNGSIQVPVGPFSALHLLHHVLTGQEKIHGVLVEHQRHSSQPPLIRSVPTFTTVGQLLVLRKSIQVTVPIPWVQ